MTAIEAYIKARVDYLDISSRVEKFGRLAKEVGDFLVNDPGHFGFSNTTGLPFEAQSNAWRNGDEWLCAETIMELLERWHELRSRMLETWGQVPPEMRSSLQAPTTAKQ